MSIFQWCFSKTLSERHRLIFPGVFQCPDMIHGRFIVIVALIVYQTSTKAQHEAGCTLKRHEKKSELTVQRMPLSMVWILRHTKAQHGINKTVLCVLACCELAFNTFPRAASEMCWRSPEMVHNILHRPSAYVLFSVTGERHKKRNSGTVKLAWP